MITTGQPRRNGYVLAMSADDWNARYPVGTPVTAYPGFRPEIGGADVPTLHTTTRSRAWNLGAEPVVMVDGYAGGISLNHIDPRDEPAPDPATTRPAWRCTATNPDTSQPCWLPDGHHGRDATNNWDLHQSENGEQW